MLHRSLVLAAAFSLFPSAARAANDDGVLIGNEAALSGGAVTAIASDGNALWYNPAGVASVHRDTVDVNGSVFILRRYRASPLIEADTGEAVDGKVTELVSVPNGLSYVRPAGDRVHLGYGIFVSESFDLGIRQRLALQRADARSEWLVNYALDGEVYHAGGGIAAEVAPGLRVGASLFGVYASASSATLFSGGLVDEASGESSGFLTETARASFTQLGLDARLGIQWDPSPRWSLGASLALPSLAFFNAFSFDQSAGIAVAATDAGGAAFGTTLADDDEWGAQLRAPARLRLGVAHHLNANSWLSLDVDVQHALRDADTGVDRDWVFNARIGGRLDLGDRVVLGAGIFTDLAPGRGGTLQFSEAEFDFVGATLGVTYDTEHQLASDERGDTLAFRTAIALRYAYGFGSVGGLGVSFYDPERPPEQLVGAVEGSITVHELGVHLGSALLF